MIEISEEQKELLEEIEKGTYSPEEAVDRILLFLRKKPGRELLSPKWGDIWDKYGSYAEGIFDPPTIKEIKESINLIWAPDKEIWDIRVDNDTRVTFLLGAGASAPSGIPTVDKLLAELWKRARKIGREDLDRLATWCNERRITNIEDLLTAAYISDFVAKNRSVTSLFEYFFFSGQRNQSVEEKYLIERSQSTRTLEIDASSISFLQDTLQTLFGLLMSTMISANPNFAHEAIVDFIKDHKNTSIVTTNYDGCMDQAILEAGMNLKRTIDSNNKNDDVDGVNLIKMHGSISWTYCDSCQNVREFDLLYLKKLYETDRLSFPVIGICKNCGGLRRPLLVPPLSFKFLMFPNLINTWDSARQSIKEADCLIIVGYSFSEADTYITKIISRSMSINKHQKMIIVDMNPNLAPYLRERFSSRIDGFEKKRILEACGSSEKILPEVLGSMLGKSDMKK
ncbi:MAG: SIR2 family protein [Theionarchaea archaeon]|nr:SIR2 family protein [Theionarchaea archaeon]